MKLLITGASGFLGRSFAKAALADGHDVYALARRPSAPLELLGLELIVRDILRLQPEDLPEGLEAFVHFATGVDGDEDRIVEVAVQGTLQLFEIARARGAERFIHISSMSVYSGRAGGREIELHPEARGAYARSKVFAEKALLERLESERHGVVEVTVIRPGLVFGYGMTSPLMGTAIELPLGLSVGLGRPEQGVPFVTAGDLEAGILLLLRTSLREPREPIVFDVLSGRPPTKRELLAVHEDLCGRPGRTIWVPRPIALAAAAAVDGLRALRGRPRRAWHNVNRLYRFEPTELDATAFWRAVGHQPTGRLRTGIRAAMTVERDEPETQGCGIPRSRASQLLDTPTKPLPDAAPVQLVLVGAGRIATDMHVPALRHLPAYIVSAVVDTDIALAETVAATFPGCRASDRLDALADSLFNRAVVVIASPGFTHHSVAVEAFERGASLLIEKPAVLTSGEYADLWELGKARSHPITVFHNYRLRPGSRALWRFLASHDVGRLLHAVIVFHSPRLETERARWMREEKRHRTLLMELAIHMIDLACVVSGELTEMLHHSVVDDPRSGNTLSVSAATRSKDGTRVDLNLDLSGTAARSQIVFSFERVTCVLDLFPDAFRVLPRRANPVDDFAYDARRLTAALGARFGRHTDVVPLRARPHHEIYLRHLRRLVAPEQPDPFSLDAIQPTMRSLFMLSDYVYPFDDAIG